MARSERYGEIVSPIFPQDFRAAFLSPRKKTHRESNLSSLLQPQQNHSRNLPAEMRAIKQYR